MPEVKTAQLQAFVTRLRWMHSMYNGSLRLIVLNGTSYLKLKVDVLLGLVRLSSDHIPA